MVLSSDLLKENLRGGCVQVADIDWNTSAFQPRATLPETHALNQSLIDGCKRDTKWWTCGAEEYRRRRRLGETPFPPPDILPHASELLIPSKHRKIPCRVFDPQSTGSRRRGVLYHIHGGGWVLGSAAGQDLLLDEIARKTQLVVVSVEYRLAPEHPFPAGPEDSCEVADWLVANSMAKWGCDLKFVCGESAGATLVSLVLLHLRDSGQSSTLAGAILSYGCFDLSILPSVHALDPDRPLILDRDHVNHFIEAYTPGLSGEERKSPKISPAYNSLRNLTSALFIVGTEDGLVDDTVLMSGKWRLAGNEAVVKFVPGAPHGFVTFNGNEIAVTRQAWDSIIQYILSKI